MSLTLLLSCGNCSFTVTSVFPSVRCTKLTRWDLVWSGLGSVQLQFKKWMWFHFSLSFLNWNSAEPQLQMLGGVELCDHKWFDRVCEIFSCMQFDAVSHWIRDMLVTSFRNGVFYSSSWSRKALNWFWSRLWRPSRQWLIPQRRSSCPTTTCSCPRSNTSWRTPFRRSSGCSGERPSSASAWSA